MSLPSTTCAICSCTAIARAPATAEVPVHGPPWEAAHSAVKALCTSLVNIVAELPEIAAARSE
jgi:hypothetical protein